MQIVVLASFVLALMLVHPSALADLMAPGWPAAAAMGGYLLGAGALARLHAALGLRVLRQSGGASGLLKHCQGVVAVAGQCWLIGGSAGVIALGFGQWVVQDLHLGNIPLVGKLAALGPFLAALTLTWVLDYPFYRALRRRVAEQELLQGSVVRTPWTLGQYLAYNTRHHVLFIAVPVGLIVLLTDVLAMYVEPLLGRSAEYVLLPLVVTSAAGVFLLSPALIVRIWRTTPLPPGALRANLQEACRAMDLRCRDLLVWHSGGMIANAGVMGLIPHVRYVLLSDCLLEQMDPREIQAIFAHEAGHIASKHLLYAAIFGVSTVLLCGAAGEVLMQSLNWPPWAGEVAILSMLAVTWAIGFGWISRWFERQSDVIAAWASSRPQEEAQALDPSPGADAAGGLGSGRITPEGSATFARALERVGQLNGIPPRQRNWRHGSIANRVSYVLWLASVGGTRQRVDQVVRRIKLGLWVALAAAVAVTVWQLAGG